MFKKRAQGMSLNVIIIAALGLIVLVILSVVLMGRMGFFTKNSNDCSKLGGTCMDRTCDEGYKMRPGTCYGSDNKPDQYAVCCTELSI